MRAKIIKKRQVQMYGRTNCFISEKRKLEGWLSAKTGTQLTVIFRKSPKKE
jgi:hypothetical protein